MYRTPNQISKNPPSLEELPYLKRKAYEHEAHEAEYRPLYTSEKRNIPAKGFAFPIGLVDPCGQSVASSFHD